MVLPERYCLPVSEHSLDKGITVSFEPLKNDALGLLEQSSIAVVHSALSNRPANRWLQLP
jgi:hypothetical protein